MTFARQPDKVARRTSRNISRFNGVHYGVGRTDQPDEFAFGADLESVNKKAELRDGLRKNLLRGYDASVTSMFSLNIGGKSLVGVVQDGTLSVYPLDDLLDQILGYYSWDEVRGEFTWDELRDGKTWNDLIEGNR